MIEYWKCQQGFKPIESIESGCWIQVTNPTQDELELLEKQYQVPMDYIHDVKDPGERPRIDTDEGWLISVLRIPDQTTDEDGEVVYATRPIAVLVRDDLCVSVSYFRPEMLKAMIAYSIQKQIPTRQGYDILLSIFLSAAVWYLNYLRQMNQAMEKIDDALEASMDNEQLRAMMRLEKFLVFFITSLRGNEIVMTRLKRLIKNISYDEDLLDDAEIELQQAYSTAQIYNEVLERQRESYASIISNNLNTIMQRLTVITLILMLPACVSGFIGMNVINGMEDYWFSFPCILLFTVILCVVAYFILKRQKMF